MEQHDYVVVCVESQKGGVGKTTAALNAARLLLESRRYEVLFLDLDIAGTEAALAAKAQLWKTRTHIVSLPIGENIPNNIESGKPSNIVDLFGKYMLGDHVPNIIWRELPDISEPNSPSITLLNGKINIISSILPADSDAKFETARHFGYGPSVLFDRAHSQWFLDMIRQLIANAAGMLNRKTLAIVVDTSPGYSGLGPTLEEWLTDLGPKRAKVLIVNALDDQDLVACVRAVVRIENLYQAKLKGMKAFQELLATTTEQEPKLNNSEERFFARLASADSDIPYEIRTETQESKLMLTRKEDLAFYKDSAPKEAYENVKAAQAWWGILFNRIPPQIINGEYEYQWQEIIDDCVRYGKRAVYVAKRCKELFAIHPIAYSDAFAFQFIAERLRPAALPKGEPHALQSAVSQISLPTLPARIIAERVLSTQSIMEGAGKILAYLEDCEALFRRMVEPVWNTAARTRDKFEVEWGQYAPTWLFTGVLRTSPAMHSTLRRHMASNIRNRIERAQMFIRTSGHAFTETMYEWVRTLPDELNGQNEAGVNMPQYVLSSMLAAIAIRQSRSSNSTLAQKEMGAHVSRTQRMIMMACEVHQQVTESGVVPLSEDFWTRGASDEGLVRHAEAIIATKWKAIFGQKKSRSQPLTKEFMAFSRSQLTLVCGNSDAAVVLAAVRVIAETARQGAMAALVDRILEETLVARFLSHQTALSDFSSVVHGSVGERPDPIRMLKQMDVMDDFSEALRPILGESNWGLL